MAAGSLRAKVEPGAKRHSGTCTEQVQIFWWTQVYKANERKEKMIEGSQQEFVDELFGIVDTDDTSAKVRFFVDDSVSGEIGITLPATDGGKIVAADASGNVDIDGAYLDMNYAGTSYLRVTGANRDFAIRVNDGGVYRNAINIDSSLAAKVSTYGDLYVGDDLIVNDDLTVNGCVSSDLIPDSTNTLGDDSDFWDEIHYDSLYSHSIADYQADENPASDVLRIKPADKSTYPANCFRAAKDVIKTRRVRDVPDVDGKITHVKVLSENTDGTKDVEITAAGSEAIDINQVIAMLIEHNKDLENRVRNLEDRVRNLEKNNV